MKFVKSSHRDEEGKNFFFEKGKNFMKKGAREMKKGKILMKKEAQEM